MRIKEVEAVIDKLDVTSFRISEHYLRLAMEEGHTGYGYRKWTDLRKAEPALPAILYCKGRHGGIHKLSLVGVARLGWRNCKRVIRRVFGTLKKVRIYRIDVCVDILGKSVWHFAEQYHLSRTQNFRLYKERGAASVYLQWSAERKVVVYDKGWLLRKKRSPFAMMLKSYDQLTRIEIQMSGSGVPFRSLRDLRKYESVKWLTYLALLKFRTKLNKQKPMQFLAQLGLLTLISEYGLQGASKVFTGPAWAFLKNKFLRLATKDEASELSRRIQKSVCEWMNDRIRSPRFNR
jgi:hypothetical protein